MVSLLLLQAIHVAAALAAAAASAAAACCGHCRRARGTEVNVTVVAVESILSGVASRFLGAAVVGYFLCLKQS